jgi:hypothetical protein
MMMIGEHLTKSPRRQEEIITTTESERVGHEAEARIETIADEEI